MYDFHKIVALLIVCTRLLFLSKISIMLFAFYRSINNVYHSSVERTHKISVFDLYTYDTRIRSFFI